MQIGTFVGQETLEFSQAEIENVKKMFEDTIRRYFVCKNITVEEHYESSMKYIQITAHDVVYPGKRRVIGLGDDWFIRTGDIIDPKGNISIIVRSQMGYDEAKVGKFYEWPKGWKAPNDVHQYEITLCWPGRHKTYRHHHWGGLDIKQHYFWGTEFSDMKEGLDGGIHTICETYRFSTPIK